MRISVQLIVGCLACAGLVALVGLVSHAANRYVRGQFDRLSRSSIIQVVDSTDMAIALGDSQVQIRKHANDNSTSRRLSATDDEQFQDLKAALMRFERGLEQSRLANDSLLHSAEQAGDTELAQKLRLEVRDRLKQLNQAFVEYRGLVNQWIQGTTDDDAMSESSLGSDVALAAGEGLRLLVLEQKHRAEQEFTGEVRGVERLLASADQRIVMITLLALVVALTLAFVLARSIGNPLAQLQVAATQIGAGNLATRTHIRRRDEIGVLATTINQMAADLQATTVSKAYVDNILHSMNDMLIVVDAQLTIQRFNPAATQQLGYREAELLSRPLCDLIEPPQRELFQDGQPSASLVGTRSLHLRGKNGEPISVLFTAAEIRGPQGRLEGLVCNAVNMTERLLAEDQLRASLHEKEVLLKEVHHRVKNNLQIICSLLSLQSREANDPQTARLFEDSQGRIRSMALIHEQLYQSAELARIDFAEYSQQLCRHLTYSSGWHSDRLTVHLDVDRVPLSLDIAIPCGMILNELISNAMKHGFPEGRAGEICVEFRSDRACRRLIVRDNGVGVDLSTARQKPTLGLTLVEALVRQLKGNMSIEAVDGTLATIEFPDDFLPLCPATESDSHLAKAIVLKDPLHA